MMTVGGGKMKRRPTFRVFCVELMSKFTEKQTNDVGVTTARRQVQWK
jgi:hypothetical protein